MLPPAAAGSRRGKKRVRGEWMSAEVVRVLRGGSFEASVPVGPAEEEDKEEGEGEEEEERAAPMKKVKMGLEAIEKEWRYTAA